MKYRLDLFRLWMMTYFKHSPENIRQASPIVPGRLYHNFGNICKAVKHTARETEFIKNGDCSHSEAQHTAEQLLEVAKSAKGNATMVKNFQSMISENYGTPPRCQICDFHRFGIPCPLHNCLADGTIVCETHRYIIIKQA